MPIRKYYRTDNNGLKKDNKKRKRGKLKRLIKFLGVLFVLGLLSGAGVFAYFSSQVPNLGNFEDRVVVQSTKIYDRDGSHLLYETGKEIKRTYVTLDKISPYLQKATITAEDDDFYKHPGIDIKSTFRALVFDIVNRGKGIQGGSTLTQQLIKNAMLTPERTISRKIKEAILTLEIERRYSKDKILEFYLNEVPYGSIFYGVEAASQNYFQKPASDLTLAEAATLASLIRSPTYYLNHGEEREKRKNWILERMVELGLAAKEETDKAKDEKVNLQIAPRPKLAPYFTTEVEKELSEIYGERYQKMGLRVYSTLNFSLQEEAEKIISEWGPKIEKWYGAENAALMSINPNNGEILVMMGGKDFEKSQVNIWTPELKDSFQSPGSTFKPIVYATAFKKGYTPNTIIFDAKTNFSSSGNPYLPDNFDLKERGPIKMKEALAQSLNIPAVKTLYLAGIDEVANTAKSMGMLESFKEYSDAGLSMAIGGKDIAPIELVSAFGVFAAEGNRNLPKYILKIEDSKGKVVFEEESQPIKVLDSEICRKINTILSDNNLRSPIFGSHSYLNIGPWVAVKTGTAAKKDGKVTDVWTIGYTKNLVTGVWVGNNKNEPMYGKVEGSTTAAPIWNAFMKIATKNESHQGFIPAKEEKTGKPILDGYIQKTKVKIDKISGKIATELTPPELIEEKDYFQPHSILYYVNKDDPRGPYPKNPQTDPAFKNWEEGVKSWLNGNEFKVPTEKDDIHTETNKPNIEILSKNSTLLEVSFQVKVAVPLGIKKIEVFSTDDGKNLSLIETVQSDYSFKYSKEELGNKEKYNFRVIATDTAENKGEIEVAID